MAKIKINRAPVMTLWATVVAERLGFAPDEAVTLGKAVTGLNAQAKGQRLGIFHPSSEEERQNTRQTAPGEIFHIEILGRPVPATNTPHGLRAVDKDEPIDPSSVRRYLEKKFGPSLGDARRAMEDLASSFSPEELARRAYPLYEKFRPQVPEGTRGWGAAGELDLDKIHSLISTK